MHIASEATLKALTASVVALNDAMQRFNVAFTSFITSLEDAEWVNTDRASKLTGLTPRQLRYKAENGAIRAKKDGKNFLFFSDDLIALRRTDIA
jgi:hypothetical protein